MHSKGKILKPVITKSRTWPAERKYFGSSKLPWSLPGARKIDCDGSCPEAERALADHVALSIHENWTMPAARHTIRTFGEIEKTFPGGGR